MKTSVDPQEINKFSALSNDWWDKDGSLKTLHDINPPRIEFIQKWAELKGRRVLDVGCGGGILSEAMARLGAKVTGIDADLEGVETAKTHAQNENISIEYKNELVENLKRKPFDVITCMEMLEHVSDPGLVISHCARLLKPGGVLFLSTLNRTLKSYATAIVGAEYILRILPQQTHDYQKFIKPSELSKLVRSEGLDVLGIEGLGYNPFTRQAYFQSSVEVNYLMVCHKPEG